jgi:hypothetical protein
MRRHIFHRQWTKNAHHPMPGAAQGGLRDLSDAESRFVGRISAASTSLPRRKSIFFRRFSPRDR